MQQEMWPMELDEPRPKKHPEIILGEPLDLLSIAELAQRISDLESEIARARQAINQKQAGKAAADAVFKR
jgi:uncharacterized small protein (DUF1192 family)